jgi:hypothetical protein
LSFGLSSSWFFVSFRCCLTKRDFTARGNNSQDISSYCGNNLLIIFAACGRLGGMATKELTTSEAAAHLDESDRLVRLWCQQGRFPNARRVEHPRGDYWIIPLHDVEGFIKPKPGPTPRKSADTGEKTATGRIRASNGTSTTKKGGKK